MSMPSVPRRRVMQAALAIATLVAAIAPAARAGAEPLREAFAYTPSAPLEMRRGRPRKLAPGVVARDIDYVYAGGRVSGELIGPVVRNSARPGPAILFVHWLGEPKTTNHTEFEADAVALAAHGFTCLLVDAMWAAPGWFDTMGVDAATDYRRTVDQVVDLRRALDLLQSQPGVDPARIAYVGHDFGAMMGTLLAGVDARPSRYVLITPTATLPEWYLLGRKAADPAAYEAAFARLALAPALERSRAKGYFFQFAAKDEYVPQARGLMLFAAAPAAKEAHVYNAGHDLETPQAHAERIAWLLKRLR
jgi:pimeloyl-ACP methyl ester carboxylesterase